MHRLLFGTSLLVACQSDGPDLSTNAQPIVVVSPVGYDFGALVVGLTSAPLTISVNPATGDQVDLITAVTASCPDFTITASEIPAGVFRICKYDDLGRCTTTEYVTYQFDAGFRPQVAGPVSCVVKVETNNDTYQSITLTGSGTLPAIDIDVQPTSIAFGDVREMTSSSGSPIEVRNLGSEPLNVTATSLSAGFADASPAGGYVIPTGGARPHMISCNPPSAGALVGELVVNSDDPTTPVVRVPLSCNGVVSTLDITPSPATIPTTRVGEPRGQMITLTNSGLVAMVLDSVVLTGADFLIGSAPAAGTSLAPATAASIAIAFRAAASGHATGTVVVTYDGGQTRSIPISARALGTSMSVTPDGNVDLGPVCVGQSRDQSFTIVANDQGPFAVGQISTPGIEFTVTAPALPAMIQGAGATQLVFSVQGTPTAAGPLTATLKIATDIPGAGQRDIELAVEGMPAGVSPTPAALDFGSTAIDATTVGQSVQVANCSTDPATLVDPRIEGADAGDFAIVAQPLSLDLGPAGIASFLVVAEPHSAGLKSATFVVDHAGGTVTVALDAEGLATDPPDDLGRPSYYACATGSSSATWPLALALALLFRRRRSPS